MTENISNKVFRDFIYLDKERMYSLYSQLFEGVVESMAYSITYGTKDSKTEKKLEETIIDASTKVQNVILFDHIYNSLEEKMADDLINVYSDTRMEEILPDSMIKVTGFARIEDYEHLLHILSCFNDIGSSLATIALNNDNKGKTVSKNEIDNYRKANNLYLDKNYAESLIKIIDEVHGKSMEVTIPITTEHLDIDFRAFLPEEHLRISQQRIKDIYGYAPCMQWTIVGQVTNLSHQNLNTSLGKAGILSGLFASMESLNKVFLSLTGDRNTVRIAPIAIYVEHNTRDTKLQYAEALDATYEI